MDYSDAVGMSLILFDFSFLTSPKQSSGLVLALLFVKMGNFCLALTS